MKDLYSTATKVSEDNQSILWGPLGGRLKTVRLK